MERERQSARIKDWNRSLFQPENPFCLGGDGKVFTFSGIPCLQNPCAYESEKKTPGMFFCRTKMK